MKPLDPLARFEAWLAQPLPTDVSASLDRLRRSEGIRHVAVMPDVHLSGSFCIGTVIASRDRIYPDAVGGDIGCGMVALRFDALASEVLGDERNSYRILRALRTMVPTNRHSKLTLRADLPPHLNEAPLGSSALRTLRRRDGRVQFGTLGRGNHFLEVQRDEQDNLWVMVHSGSRGMGQAIARHHAKACREEPGGLRYLEGDSDEGRAYMKDVEWARDYAGCSRVEMVDATSALLEEFFRVRPAPESLIHCDHNHVQREAHDGIDYWVHRKGALSARDGETGIVPGSMGTRSFHTVGRGCEKALSSSSHGAGRALSRTEARQKVSAKELRRQMRGVWFDHSMENRLRDEAPSAYKDIGVVMRAQKELTRVVRQLEPLLVYKG